MGKEPKIDSYEPYMIGLKFKQSIQIDSVEKNIKKILQDKGFEVAFQPPEMPGPGISLRIGPPVDILGIKNGTELKINKEAHALNIEGENPEIVKEILNEMPEIFKEIKLTINDAIIFYEIITNIIIEATDGKSPREVVNNSNKINLDHLSELKTYVSGIKINSIDEESRKLIGLVIEPKAGNPHNFYFVNLIFRSPEVGELKDFHDKLPKKVIEVIKSLEE